GLRVFDRLEDCESGVVHQNVKRSSGIDETLAVVAIRDVRHDCCAYDAALAAAARNLIEQLCAAGGDHDIRAAAGEFERRRPANAGRGSGDHRSSARELQWQVYSIDCI